MAKQLSDLDFGSVSRILNLPAPLDPTEPVRLSDLLKIISPTAISTKQNDWSPTGLSGSTGRVVLNVDLTTCTGIAGLLALAVGTEVEINNISTDYLLWLEHENPSSTAANRVVLPNSFPAFLMPGDSITLRYGSNSRWRVISWPNQGQAMGLTEFGDFMAAIVVPYTTNNANSGILGAQSSIANTTNKVVGAVQVSTGTNAAGASFLAGSSAAVILGQGCMFHIARIGTEANLPNGTQTYTIATGFGELLASPVDAALWEIRWNGSSVEASQTTVSNSSATRTTTGSPTIEASTFYSFGVFVNADASRVDFIYSTDSVNYVLASSATTGIPSGSGRNTGVMGLGIVKSAGTTARLAYMDWGGVRCDQVRS